MKLWLASTDPAAVSACFELGVFHGVLTNPTLIAASQRHPREVMAALCSATAGPVFYQVRDQGVEAMKTEAGRWLELGWRNLGIKVALTRGGCALLHWLRGQGVEHRLATCVPTVTQVLLAAALDVPWITPSGSALEKMGGPSKVSLLENMQCALDRQGSATRLIPSLATPAEMQTLALCGVRHGFVWEQEVNRFVDSELVRQVAAGFAPAWAAIERSEMITTP